MTFEEKFPTILEWDKKNNWSGIPFEFVDDYRDLGIKECIEECCIDKQRHKELMEQALAEERQRVREVIKKHTSHPWPEMWSVRDIFEELGL